MYLGIKFEGWLTIAAILVGPLLAFLVQRWRDSVREKRGRQLDVFRRLVLTLKVSMSPNHVDAINSIPLEFHFNTRVMQAWRLYTSHLNDRQKDINRWAEQRFDLSVDLVFEIAQSLGYKHVDKALLKDSLYVPQGYQDTEEQLRQIREGWLKMLNGQLPLRMSIVGPVRLEEALPLLPELGSSSITNIDSPDKLAALPKPNGD